MIQTPLGRHYPDTAVATFESQKRLAERAMAQLEPADFHKTLGPETNSVAVVVKHMSGNMCSRWRDFLTSDGEKPGRRRNQEFVWEAGWATLFAALSDLTPQDLLRTVTIRGRAHSVLEAIERQISHCAQHVGQIVFLAKHQV